MSDEDVLEEARRYNGMCHRQTRRDSKETPWQFSPVAHRVDILVLSSE